MVNGMNDENVTAPTAVAEPVMSNTSQPRPSTIAQRAPAVKKPLRKSIRKSRDSNDGMRRMIPAEKPDVAIGEVYRSQRSPRIRAC